MCSPKRQESEESSSCASSGSQLPEELEVGEFLRRAPGRGAGMVVVVVERAELPGEVVGTPETESVSWSTKPHQIDFLRKRSLG